MKRIEIEPQTDTPCCVALREGFMLNAKHKLSVLTCLSLALILVALIATPRFSKTLGDIKRLIKSLEDEKNRLISEMVIRPEFLYSDLSTDTKFGHNLIRNTTRKIKSSKRYLKAVKDFSAAKLKPIRGVTCRAGCSSVKVSCGNIGDNDRPAVSNAACQAYLSSTDCALLGLTSSDSVSVDSLQSFYDPASPERSCDIQHASSHAFQDTCTVSAELSESLAYYQSATCKQAIGDRVGYCLNIGRVSLFQALDPEGTGSGQSVCSGVYTGACFSQAYSCLESGEEEIGADEIWDICAAESEKFCKLKKSNSKAESEGMSRILPDVAERAAFMTTPPLPTPFPTPLPTPCGHCQHEQALRALRERLSDVQRRRDEWARELREVQAEHARLTADLAAARFAWATRLAEYITKGREYSNCVHDAARRMEDPNIACRSKLNALNSAGQAEVSARERCRVLQNELAPVAARMAGLARLVAEAARMLRDLQAQIQAIEQEHSRCRRCP